jgi:hypothetical protein
MYRNEDIKIIEKNIDIIKDNAFKQYKTLYDPTLKENSNVYSAIKNYIKRKKKIVYGGFAQNLLVTAKNPKDSFYKIIDGVFYNWPDVADIEFYSYSPLVDIIELTEELYKLGFKYVEGKEGIHPETYKIFVNFINYCDISYMPSNIYNNLPIIETNGIKCAHPHFMMVDAYRILTDPMTSYWRLDKVINRFQKILKYYPINQTFTEKKIELKTNHHILKVIRKKIIHKSDLVIIGFYAFDYYVKKVSDDLTINNYPYYEAISKDLEISGKKILKILTNKFKNKITTKEFYPFFSLMDKRIEFYYENHLIFRLFGNNERCTIYNYSKKKQTNFGTYNLVFMYLLFDYFLAFIFKDTPNIELYNKLIGKFFNARNKYLNFKKITVIDKSPFQDFTLKCYGTPTEPIRNALLKGLEKIKQGKKLKFRYGPSGNHGKVPEYTFSNNSGNQILNNKYLILKNNI